jgi:hypothetical protein
METPRERSTRDEQCAFLLALTGKQIQKADPGSRDAVAKRRLFKVLANCIWDWASMPRLGNPSPFDVRSLEGLMWIPHRFGALGVVSPALEYDVDREHGLWVQPENLFACGIFATYGVKVLDPPDHPRFGFPKDIPYAIREASGLESREWYYWERLAELYAPLSDEALDGLASCRTATAAFHSLWIQLIVWCEDVSLVAEVIESARGELTQKQLELIEKRIGYAAAAASNFSIKASYWRKRRDIAREAARVFEGTEFEGHLPSAIEIPDCPFASHLDALLNLEAVVHSVSVLFEGPCNSIDLGPRKGKISFEDGEKALLMLSDGPPGPIDSVQELGRLWFGRRALAISEFAIWLVASLSGRAGREVGIEIKTRRAHYRDFERLYNPLHKLRAPSPPGASGAR